MPKKNKAKPNGFYQFMKDQKLNNPIFANVPITEMATKVDPLWKKLSQDDKRRYNEFAKNLHDNKPVERYTSDGVSISMLEQRQEEKEREKERMKMNINRLIESAIIRKQLPQEIFLIMHINSLVYHPNNEYWYVCEIAVSPFSLSRGVLHEEIFHRYIKPGPLPLGYRAAAKEHSELTHKLDSVVLDTDEDNTSQVYNDLLRFMNKFAKDGELPYVYVRDLYIDMTRNVLDRFLDDYDFGKEISVYSLEYMFFVLRNKVKPQTWPTDTFSFSAIDKDDFSHISNIGCEYHEMADISLYCSKSITTRYAYTICDHCCQDMGIMLVPGMHIPTTGGGYGLSQSASTSVCGDPVESSSFTTVQYKGAKSKKHNAESSGAGRNMWESSGSGRNRRDHGGGARKNYAHSITSEDNAYPSQLSQDDTCSMISGISAVSAASTQSTYQDDYPALGAFGGRSQGKMSKDSQNYARVASSRGSSLVGDLEDMSLSDPRTDTSNLRFPSKGYNRPHRQQ